MSKPETTRHQGAFSATLAGLMDRLTSRGADVYLTDTMRLDGKTVLVTGASRGLGLAISKEVAGRGARLIMACRSRHDQALAEVCAASGSQLVEVLKVDLASPASVDQLADALRDRGESLDRVILNAGVVPKASRTTEAGLDIMFHVNFLANVQLIDRLLDNGTLVPNAKGPEPRIVVVASEAHRSAPPIDFDTFDTPKDYGTSEVVGEYGKSKLLLMTWVRELTRRLDTPDGPSIGVHALCPGAINSSIAREAPGWSKPILNVAFRVLFQSPETAARPVIWLTASPELDRSTGTYLHMLKIKDPSAEAMDEDKGAKLWREAHAVLDRIHPS